MFPIHVPVDVLPIAFWLNRFSFVGIYHHEDPI